MRKAKKGMKAYSRYKAKQKIELTRTLKIIIMIIIITQYYTHINTISINISVAKHYEEVEGENKGKLKTEREDDRKNLEQNKDNDHSIREGLGGYMILWKRNCGGAAPALGDIDNDGKIEIVLGGYFYACALNGEDGTILWKYYTDDLLPPPTAPLLGDINNDGDLEVIIRANYRIYALNGEDGTTLWSFTTWGHVSIPALGDIDGDGKLEVVVGSWDCYLYAINAEDGSLLWSRSTELWISDTPALGDINNDGKIEVVLADYQTLYVFDGKTGNVIWSYKLEDEFELFEGSPLLGDLDGDGKLEIIVPCSLENTIYAFNVEDKTILWNRTMDRIVLYTPALGDIDGDGKLEIVTGSIDHNIYALNGEDGTILWNYTTGDYISSRPTLGDLDGDGKVEVIIGGNDWKIYVIDGSTGDVIWFYTTEGGVAVPVLGDLNGDGKIELLVNGGGILYAFAFFSAGEHIYWQGVGGALDFTRTGNQFDIDPDYDCLATEYEKIIGTDPYNNDSDGDNIKDSIELYIYHTDPTNSDTDGDGFRDDIEIKLGTDPTKPENSPLTVYTLPSVATVIITALILFSYRRLEHHFRIKSLLKVTGAPSYAEAIKVKEGKFKDYEEYKLAQKLNAPNKEALELTTTLGAPDYPTAQKVQEAGFKDYQSYRLALQQGYKTYEGWQSFHAFRSRLKLFSSLLPKIRRFRIADLLSLLRFDDFEQFYLFLSSLPSDLVVIDGDYVLFPFVSSDDETFHSALERLLSSFSSFWHSQHHS